MKNSLEWALGAFLTSWLGAGLVCAMLVSADLGHWIELFNGATWPGENELSSKDGGFGHLFCFFAVLGLRTLLNMGIVLTAGWAIVVLLGGGIERFVMRRMESVLHGRDIALTGYLIKVLRDQHFNLSPALEDRLMEAAEKFPETPAGKVYQDEAHKAVAA